VSRFVELLGLAAGGRGGTGRGTAAARWGRSPRCRWSAARWA